MKRTKELQSFLDKFAKKAFGISQTKAKEKNICVFFKFRMSVVFHKISLE